jgi:uncharacterized protein (DUF1697 family)
MPHYLALLRGVNVGRAARVPMARWRELLEGIGCTGVRTVLNSGNALFASPHRSAPALARAVHGSLVEALGVDVHVVVLEARALRAVVAGNPLRVAADQHPRVLAIFAQERAAIAGLAALEPLLHPDEKLVIGPQAAYLYCAGGILESRAGKALLGKAGQAVTTRNWATVLRLAQLAVGA